MQNPFENQGASYVHSVLLFDSITPTIKIFVLLLCFCGAWVTKVAYLNQCLLLFHWVGVGIGGFEVLLFPKGPVFGWCWKWSLEEVKNALTL